MLDKLMTTQRLLLRIDSAPVRGLFETARDRGGTCAVIRITSPVGGCVGCEAVGCCFVWSKERSGRPAKKGNESKRQRQRQRQSCAKTNKQREGRDEGAEEEAEEEDDDEEEDKRRRENAGAGDSEEGQKCRLCSTVMCPCGRCGGNTRSAG